MRSFSAVFLLMLMLASTAHAQLMRALPANGKLGVTGESMVLPSVRIGNQVLRLAPGGVILDQNNRTIVHAHLPQQATVLYTQDNLGQISRIVVLTPEELARIQAGKK
jgi:hypothetical protein